MMVHLGYTCGMLAFETGQISIAVLWIGVLDQDGVLVHYHLTAHNKGPFYGEKSAMYRSCLRKWLVTSEYPK